MSTTKTKGTWGGKRAGAGRKAAKIRGVAADDPKVFLKAVMNDTESSARLRIDAAKALLPYEHAKAGASGKKDAAAEAAKAASAGKFKPAAPPRLSVVKT